MYLPAARMVFQVGRVGRSVLKDTSTTVNSPRSEINPGHGSWNPLGLRTRRKVAVDTGGCVSGTSPRGREMPNPQSQIKEHHSGFEDIHGAGKASWSWAARGPKRSRVPLSLTKTKRVVINSRAGSGGRHPFLSYLLGKAVRLIALPFV